MKWLYVVLVVFILYSIGQFVESTIDRNSIHIIQAGAQP